MRRKQRIVLEGFSVSVAKLVIEQDADGGHVLPQDGVRQALTQLIAAPVELLADSDRGNGLQARHGENVAVEQETPEKKRRRRQPRVSASSGTQANGEGNIVAAVKGYVLELKGRGFFNQEHPVNGILDKLHEAGHTTVKSQPLGVALLQLTKEKDPSLKLYRRKGGKDEHGKDFWVYRESSYDGA